MTALAQVVPLARLGRAGGAYTYRLPPALQPFAAPGVVVRVPFGTRMMQGLVLEVEDEGESGAAEFVQRSTFNVQRGGGGPSPPQPPSPTGGEGGDAKARQLRDVEEILDPEPLLVPHQIGLARWLAAEYAAPLADVVGAMLPPGLARKPTFVYELSSTFNVQRSTPGTVSNVPEGPAPGGRGELWTQRVPPAPRDPRDSRTELQGPAANTQNAERRTQNAERLLAVLAEHGRLDRERLAQLVPGVDVERAVKPLLDAVLVVRRAELLPPRTTPRQVRVFEMSESGRAALRDGARLGSRQRAVLETLAEIGSASARELGQRLDAKDGAGLHSVTATLLRRGLVVAHDRTERRDPLAYRSYPGTAPPPLAAAQQAAYEEIVASLGEVNSSKFKVQSSRSGIGGGDRGGPSPPRPPSPTRGERGESERRTESSELRTQNSELGGCVFLLHGVTGSGKTEVYMQVIARVLASGRQAIVMVPEISLTPQAVARFAGRFPGRVAVLHSRLSAGERLDEWQRIRAGEADIVVGPRSALFAPLPRLGLIVVDEEHDPSYKQDSSPRYHARDAAVHLASELDIPVILGSATPDVASYYAARKGRYHLLELPSRPVWPLREVQSSKFKVQSAAGRSTYNVQRSTDVAGEGHGGGPSPPRPPSPTRGEGGESGQGMQNAERRTQNSELGTRPMPTVQVVDLRQELKAGNRTIFSRALTKALGETLAARQQAVLFLNRRGSASVVVCRDCGFVVRCPDCDIPMTYHASFTQLVCHRCDRRQWSPKACPECASPRIRYLGVGTERVAEETERLFAGARVLRWDRDVTSTKGAHEDILDRFGRHEADVLVGTQMIAKGLDFPLVTLVGVVSADVGLHLPDFHAPERTFQLLTQVAGRGGRAELPSRVIVQAYTPDHYAILAAKDHDYWSFYRQEMTFRHGAGYPPFSRLLRLVTGDRHHASARARAFALRDVLMETIETQGLTAAEVIGPAPAFVARIKGIYQWHLLVRAPEVHPLLDVVPEEWTVDVDPVDLL